MFCTACGREMGDLDVYCAQCGKSIHPPARPKRLARLPAEKKITGVCAGFARYFDVDVTIVRMIWIALALLHGFGILAYIVAWIVLPSANGPACQRQYA